MKLNALIVTAHPFTHSFNLALSAQAEQQLRQAGWHVEVSNLYQQGFSPIAGALDVGERHLLEGANLLQLQAEAVKQNRLADDILTEQAKLNSADLIILQFPIWWGTMPAMLKGWLERVFSYGYAYGEQYALEGKALMMSVTTGGARDDEERQYYDDKLQDLANETFGYMKMRCLPAFICHGPASSSQDERVAELKRFGDTLDTLIATLD